MHLLFQTTRPLISAAEVRPWEKGGHPGCLVNPKRYRNASETLRMPIPGYTNAEPTSQPVLQQHIGGHSGDRQPVFDTLHDTLVCYTLE